MSRTCEYKNKERKLEKKKTEKGTMMCQLQKKRNDDVHSFRFYKIKQRWRLIFKKGYIPPNNHTKKERKVTI